MEGFSDSTNDHKSMITVNIAHKNALAFWKPKFPEYDTLQSCIDIGNAWVFNFTNDDLVRKPGIPLVIVSKITAECDCFTIPPMENLDLLDLGEEVDVCFL
jgi:hypothetical protein